MASALALVAVFPVDSAFGDVNGESGIVRGDEDDTIRFLVNSASFSSRPSLL
jgi:hypothetical protein